MLYLKEINLEDIEEEYKAIKAIPAKENGFENKYHDVTRKEFETETIPELINHSQGIGLKKGYVPETYYFLWDDNKIVGLFKIRHYLNDFLKKGAGHIGAGILPGNRGKKYGEQGLTLAIEKCIEKMKEDEIYLAVHKNNPASLRMQLKNNAYIVSETEDEFLTRIKPNIKDVTFGYRDLVRNDWKRIIEKDVVIDDIKNDLFEGKASLLKMEKVTSPLIVDSPIGKKTIAADGYKHLMIAPKNKNWWLTIMFDENDNLIESYFDITRVNCFDTEIPFFIDMKLDICIPSNGEVTIMDEDELKEVLDKGMITQEDYDNALLTANKIIEIYNQNKELYYNFINELYEKMNQRMSEYLSKKI